MAGTWGPREVAQKTLLRPLMTQFASYRSEADSFIAEGDRVVVQARADAVTKAGERYDQTYCFVCTVRDGQLTEVVEHCNTALVERVLELPSQPPQPAA